MTIQTIFHFNLPFPPSVNHIYKQVGTRKYLDPKVNEYRAKVIDKTKPLMLDGLLAITCVANAPDRRKRDLDNLLKATLDALQYARVIVNDEQVAELTIKRGSNIKGGAMTVEIECVE